MPHNAASASGSLTGPNDKDSKNVAISSLNPESRGPAETGCLQQGKLGTAELDAVATETAPEDSRGFVCPVSTQSPGQPGAQQVRARRAEARKLRERTTTQRYR